MSLEQARSWQVKVYHSAVVRGHEELARSSGWVTWSPFVKPLDPPGTREEVAALSEKQMSLRPNATASRNASAQRTDDTRGMECRAYVARGLAVTFNAT